MSFRTCAQFSLIALLLLVAQSSSSSAGTIVNGDFETSGVSPDPFAGWTTPDPLDLPPIDAGGVAEFDIVGYFDPLIELQQTFTLPAGASTLSFEFNLSSITGGVSDPFALPDSFQATLLDSTPASLFPIFGGVLDAFYLFDASGFEDKSSGVTTEALAGGWTRVSLDISSLGPQDLTIEFLALGDDDELLTTVLLDNVFIAQGATVPEPSSIALWSILGAAAFPVLRRRKGTQRVAS